MPYTPTGYDYFDIVHAIEEYYGRNDIWLKYAQGSASEILTPEYAAFMDQVPGVIPKVSASGKILGYEYVDTISSTSTASTAAQAFNSNVATTVATASGSASEAAASEIAGTVTKVKVPVNATASAGKVATIKSGVATAGNFVFNDVVPAAMAVACAAKLGKVIDSTLYSVNPDFWDSNGMGIINPETWDFITEGEEDKLGARMLNSLFSLDPNTGNGQMYADEMTLAYMAAFMAQQGVFDPSGGKTVPTSIIEDWGVTNYPNILKISGSPATYRFKSGTSYYTRTFDTYTIDGTPTIAFLNASNSITALTASGNIDDFTVSWAQSFTYDGKTVYFISQSNSGGLSDITTINPPAFTEGSESVYIPYNNDMYKYLAWGMIYGTAGGIEGISDQSGATIFDPSTITDITDIAAVLLALKSQYPELFNNAVEYQYIDENGNQQTTSFVPIGYPNYDPNNPTQPTATSATQADSEFKPSLDDDTLNGIADLINNIIKMQVDPATGQTIYTPTPDIPTDPNKTDMGEGDTPAIVIPAGSVSALFAVYNPTQSQVDDFGAWLWSNNFVDQLKKIFNDPMESIISLHKVFGTPARGGSQNICVGYLDSGVSSVTVTNQYTEVDCGSITLLEYFGNVFDYTDTDVQLYLPFIGFVPLNVADIMRAQIGVKYHIDVLTGECLADVSVIRDLSGGVIYQYSGNCAVHYPVSSGSYIGIVGSLLGVGAGIAATAATGGAAAPLLLTSGASLLNAHTDVARSGSVSANAGAMGIKKPYMVISRPQTALPANYAYLDGIGSNQTVTLSSCSGFVKVSKIHLQNVNAFDDELSEIEQLLKDGVIIQ